jgi:hypothetical protein
MLYTEVPIAMLCKPFIILLGINNQEVMLNGLKANLPPQATIGVGFENPIMDAALKEYFNTIGGQHIKDINDTSLKKSTISIPNCFRK